MGAKTTTQTTKPMRENQLVFLITFELVGNNSCRLVKSINYCRLERYDHLFNLIIVLWTCDLGKIYIVEIISKYIYHHLFHISSPI